MTSISRFLHTRGMLVALVLCVPGHLAAQAPDQAGDIRPPKPLVEIPQPEAAPLALWLGIVGAVLAVVVAVWFWKRHARSKASASPPEIALAALSELEKSHEVMTAEVFANRAAQTVRQYIADRFGLAAPRRTTEEFLRDIESSPLIAESDHLRVFLKSCDLAKFAGSHLDSSQRGELLRAARGFVNASAKPQVIPS